MLKASQETQQGSYVRPSIRRDISTLLHGNDMEAGLYRPTSLEEALMHPNKSPRESESPKPLSSTHSSTSAGRLACGCVNKFGGFPSEWKKIINKRKTIVRGRICEQHFQAYKAVPSKQNLDRKNHSPIRQSLLEFFRQHPGIYTSRELAEKVEYEQDSVRKQLYKLRDEKLIEERLTPAGIKQWRNVAIPKGTDPVQPHKLPQTWFSCLPSK